MQVREPVYRRSIGSWRRYGQYLEPLAQALGMDIRAKRDDLDGVRTSDGDTGVADTTRPHKINLRP